MYIIIYNKITKRILKVFKAEDVLSYGYSDDCAELQMDHAPEGDYIQ